VLAPQRHADRKVLRRALEFTPPRGHGTENVEAEATHRYVDTTSAAVCFCARHRARIAAGAPADGRAAAGVFDDEPGGAHDSGA